MIPSSRLGSVMATALTVAAIALAGAGCKGSVETDPAADAALQAEQAKAQEARAAAEQECQSLPGAAKQDCLSVAGAEYERLVSEAKDRQKQTPP